MQPLVSLDDSDLLAQMKNYEDQFVERKTCKDQKDWKKTAVAFANSAPIGLPAVLFIGVKNNGEVEVPQENLDDVQKKFNVQMQKVCPRIAYIPKIVTDNGRQALAIIIPGSPLRPHFAGPAYIRRGSETVDASEQQFAQLVAQRNSKAARILEWKDKPVTVVNRTGMGHHISESNWPDATITDCNEFYVTLQSGASTTVPSSFPLSRVDISFDNDKKRLRLELQR